MIDDERVLARFSTAFAETQVVKLQPSAASWYHNNVIFTRGQLTEINDGSVRVEGEGGYTSTPALLHDLLLRIGSSGRAVGILGGFDDALLLELSDISLCGHGELGSCGYRSRSSDKSIGTTLQLF